MRAGWVAWMALASACSSEPSLVGAVAYTETGTNNIRVRDLGTGRDTLIDPGQFGIVSIAPDAQHFIYSGADLIPKLANRSGNIRRLPGSGSQTPATWFSSSVVSYWVADGAMLLPDLDGTSRAIDGAAAVSPDLTLVSNVDAQGNVDIENLDGSNRRILSPTIAPGRAAPEESMLGFTPDQHAVMVTDSSTFPNAVHIIAITDGTSIDVPDAFVGGTPFGAPQFMGASMFSSDGSEVLLQSTTELIAVTLATGAKRTITSFAPNESSGGAVFLDDQRVLWLRVDEHSMGDVGSFSLSLHVTGPGPTDDVVLDRPPNDNVTIPTIVVLPDGFIALASDVALVKTDGTPLVSNMFDGTDVLVNDLLGPTPDGKGVIIVSALGNVRYLGIDGETRDIVTTAGANNGLLAPFAAYAPGR